MNRLQFAAPFGSSYHYDTYKGVRNEKTPYIEINLNPEKLLAVYIDLMNILDSNNIYVLLETSHFGSSEKFWRTDIHPSLLASYMTEFEDFLLHDPDTQIVAIEDTGEVEIQLRPFKNIHLHGNKDILYQAELRLRRQGIYPNADFQLESPAEFDNKQNDFYDHFLAFAHRLSVEWPSQTFPDHDKKNHEKNDPYGFRGDFWGRGIDPEMN